MTALRKAAVLAGTMSATLLLAGCVVVPRAPPQIPYVAVPGPTKTEAQFRQEDTACRVAALQLPPGPGVTGLATPAQGQRAPGSQTAQARSALAEAEAAPFNEPPGVSYLRCMAARNNLIEPLRPEPQPVFSYYPAYPIYVGSYGYGGYYPWLFGPGFYGFAGGFYGGGFYGGGYPGWRGGYGYHVYGGGYRYGSLRGGGFHR